MHRFPGEVVINDAAETEGSSTPSGADEDDFFSSWDKPAIKKPSPPLSRTTTPPVLGRTPSSVNASNGSSKDVSRSASPLAKSDGTENKPAASRLTTSAALRKTTTGGPRKANVLGAKKATTKLGAKKVTGDVIDFDEAERKAKEEAERIEKLGYDPEAEAETDRKSTSIETPSITSPTPVSPKGGYGASAHTRQRSSAEMERLGMGIGRLGFGQVGGPKAAQKKVAAGGFGSVGPIKAAPEGKIMFFLPFFFFFFPSFSLSFHVCIEATHTDGSGLDDAETYARDKFGNQKGISSDEFFGKGSFDPTAQAEAKTRLQGFEGASAISSNAYFGRPEEEPVDEYGDLESAAKDFIRRFGITAGDDLENLTQMAGEVSSRLQGAIRAYLGS